MLMHTFDDRFNILENQDFTISANPFLTVSHSPDISISLNTNFTISAHPDFSIGQYWFPYFNQSRFFYFRSSNLYYFIHSWCNCFSRIGLWYFKYKLYYFRSKIHYLIQSRLCNFSQSRFYSSVNLDFTISNLPYITIWTNANCTISTISKYAISVSIHSLLLEIPVILCSKSFNDTKDSRTLYLI